MKNLKVMITSQWLERDEKKDWDEYRDWNQLISKYSDPFLSSDAIAYEVAARIAFYIELARSRWVSYKQGVELVESNKRQLRLLSKKNSTSNYLSTKGRDERLSGEDCAKYKGCECKKCRDEGFEGSEE